MQHTSVIMTIFMRHPIVGSITAVTLSTGGYFIPVIINFQLPIIFMQCIQVAVWGLAAVASFLTIIGYFKKHYPNE